MIIQTLKLVANVLEAVTAVSSIVFLVGVAMFGILYLIMRALKGFS